MIDDLEKNLKDSLDLRSAKKSGAKAEQKDIPFSRNNADWHPSAVIDPHAQIGENVKIGPFCVIGADITIGDDVIIHSHVVLDGVTTIGDGCEIFPFASIGSPTQDKKFKGGRPELIIGKNNIIREHVTMNPSTHRDGKTIVGDNGLFMVGVHIAHDCVVGNNVVMANNATLAGHVTVEDNAIIGGLSAIHQFIRIGKGAIIGGMSGVESDVIPYGRVKGERAFLAGLNLIGLERHGADKAQLKLLQKAFNQLFAEDMTLDERIACVDEQFNGYDLIDDILSFMRAKDKFPICQPKKSK